MASLELTAETLRDTFPGCDDAPLAIALLRLLAQGQHATTAKLADAVERPQDEAPAQLEHWPDVERDSDGGVVAFSGLTLQTTPHSFEVDRRTLHTWCAWDTLFLPALLNTTAHVRSTCPVTGREVELVVSCCCHVHAKVLDLQAAFALGHGTVGPLAASAGGAGCS